MAVVIWVFLGAFTGVVARFPIKRPLRVILLDVGVGVLGSCLGGALSEAYVGLDAQEVTLRSALLALLGAVVALGLYHSTLTRRGGPNRQ